MIAVRRRNPLRPRRIGPALAVALAAGACVSEAAPGGPQSSDCTPGYSPCILLGSDVDCSAGSGDGPRYSGPVSVDSGEGDPYDLDRDGDGAGCES